MKCLTECSKANSFMGMFKNFLLGFLASFVLFHLVFGQNQFGFISIDCGSNSSYSEPTTGISYVSDSGFTNTGTTMNIHSNYITTTLERQLGNLRNFPQGIRNCYNVKVKLGTKYLIRTSFLYANYDGKNSIPEFDLHFGPNFWTTVKLELVAHIKHEELIHITTSDFVEICLVNTGNGIPFISALELRPLPSTSYKTVSGSLASFLRSDIGGAQDNSTRYPDDIYDRIWGSPVPVSRWTPISTSDPVFNIDGDGFKAPSAVLNTASTVINESENMTVLWNDPDQSNQFYIYMYFAEIQLLEQNQSRIFKIYLNDKLWYSEDESPRHLKLDIIHSPPTPLPTSERYVFNLTMSENSTLPPILNALEVYKVMNFAQSTTEQADVDAIGLIKKSYEITKNWQGDPCVPKIFVWQGLNCSFDASNPPRITSLNLPSSGLIGEITGNISNLAKLEVLDLSNNSLKGSVPEFLADMPLLRVLNLSGNNLSGEIPAALTDKKNRGFLLLSLEGNPNLNVKAPSEKKKKNNVAIPIVAAVVGVIILLILILVFVYFIRRKRKPKGPVTEEPHFKSLELTSRQYSYSEILKITNNFDRLLGEGGFGKVYYGCVGDNEVAVKILSPKSAQGYREFQAEVDLLLRVHHRNLTSLVGYCNEGEMKMGLVYEYMGRGNLGSILSDEEGEILRWENRLQIALDSAQGLEYLHHGCRPPIIHRDIKSTNILLNKEFQAKLADFGLSRAFPTEGGATHVTTKVVGTLGYLDPEYYTSYRLTEKSDVYSFGVVLLELVTGRPVIVMSRDPSNIIEWVDANINQGDIHSVIDSKIKESCNINSVWKVVDIAMSCTSSKSVNRPTMNQVVSELKECLNLELNQREGPQADSATSISSMLYTELGPMSR